MFDGCGSSLDILEDKFGYRPKVCILCERDETLRYLVAEKHGISVNAKWNYSAKGGAFLYANDVDLLFVDKARILQEFVALGESCHIFVIGGSPCTDLTYAGQDHGRAGICGPASILFFTMHLALYLLATVAPRERIRFLVENAGSMHDDHFRFIRACLGLQHVQRADMTWCTSRISPAKRLFDYFSRTMLYMTTLNRKFSVEMTLLGLRIGSPWQYKTEVKCVMFYCNRLCALLKFLVMQLSGIAGPAIIQQRFCGEFPFGKSMTVLLLWQKCPQTARSQISTGLA